MYSYILTLTQYRITHRKVEKVYTQYIAGRKTVRVSKHGRLVLNASGFLNGDKNLRVDKAVYVR